MALAGTPMIPLGFKAPNFTLPNVLDNSNYTLHDTKLSKGIVVMIICNHCPYVLHVIDEIARIATEYAEKGIDFVAINANDVERYPDDSPENMKRLAAEVGFSFPYVYDESQEIAKAYQAACTPEFNLFDADFSCVYRGQLDSSRPGNSNPVTGEDLRHALDCLINGSALPTNQIPSTGCSIKWKPGNQP